MKSEKGISISVVATSKGVYIQPSLNFLNIKKDDLVLEKGKNYIDCNELLMRDKEYRKYMRKMIEKLEAREYFNKDYIEEI